MNYAHSTPYPLPKALAWPEQRLEPSRFPKIYSATTAGWQHPVFGTNNACGSTAIAGVLQFCAVAQQPVEQLAHSIWQSKQWGPDVFWGAFGTSWLRMQNCLQAHQLQAIGVNQTSRSAQSKTFYWEWLAAWVAHGAPVACVLWNRKLGKQKSAHWVVVLAINNKKQVLVGNVLSNTGLSWMDQEEFLHRWRAWGVPFTHYSGVVVGPAVKAL